MGGDIGLAIKAIAKFKQLKRMSEPHLFAYDKRNFSAGLNNDLFLQYSVL